MRPEASVEGVEARGSCRCAHARPRAVASARRGAYASAEVASPPIRARCRASLSGRGLLESGLPGFARTTPNPSLKSLPRPATGIAAIVVTAGCFATSDATVKHLGVALPVVVLLWARYLFQTTLMAGLQMTRRHWRDLLRSSDPKLQALRAGLLVANATCSFVGLQHLPLAEFTALAMLAPMASTLLAATLLGEPVSTPRWVMVGLGFFGMLAIVRPGSGALGGAVAYPIAGALLFAFFQVVTSRLASVDDMVTTNLCSGIGALVVLCAALALLPTELLPTLRGASRSQWLLIGVLGAFATLGQMAMTVAIRAAPLSMLTPFGYVQIAFAALIGWLLFSHSPDGWSTAGMVVIALAGVATVGLNAAESQRRATLAAPP